MTYKCTTCQLMMIKSNALRKSLSRRTFRDQAFAGNMSFTDHISGSRLIQPKDAMFSNINTIKRYQSLATNIMPVSNKGFDSKRKSNQNKGSSSAVAVTDNSTIFALSTAPGRAGVAMIRISGPDAVSVRIKNRL